MQSPQREMQQSCGGQAARPEDLVQSRHLGLGLAYDKHRLAIADFIEFVANSLPGLSTSIDVAELRGYRYHTGIVFSVYAPGHGRALAQGGRYDDVGAALGRARGATGFSADLRELIRLGTGVHETGPAIASPFPADASLRSKVRELRERGERVVYLLPDEPAAGLREKCDRALKQRESEWVVEELTD